MVKQDDKILIVGAGCFGISSAYHLLKRGFTNVTVIDRSDVLPAPDAASTDINKIVRTSYSDPFYAQLAHEAIQSWKNVEEWGDTYHESGVLVLGSNEAPYATDSFANDVELGARITKLDHGKSIRSVIPSKVEVGPLDGLTGYLNRDGGWAYAAQGVSRMMERVRSMGGTVLGGKAAKKLLSTGGRTSGIECADGTIFRADLVILATGSWTASSFVELDLDTSCLATGQSVATVKLTPEEADRYRQCPVILDFLSGFYMFPPNDENIMKFAVHAVGYTNYVSGSASTKAVSTPRTILSHSDEGLLIPQTTAKFLRNQLRLIYPELARKPFFSTRLCWYTDSPDGDWMIGFYRSDPGLMLATSGSGHAYKFLPVIGRLVADSIQGTLDAALVQKFSPGREHVKVDLSRSHTDITDLTVEQLCTPEDLLP
ncbi:hypothetical protein EW146_g2820 [Bondarzewia mesenterica]|uniref:FAD dependent oxidoreductase domain-containing protein n=1 Tax=Bondarzewia mesenterica TaxID=1095465 RepID=A0A4S4LZL8_9AGAM|nr:hypothetical protein EW146_g2820 [Bondarzewia mesenterica]